MRPATALPEIQAAAPAGLELKLDFDQSVFVRAAVQNVIREAIISSILVSVLILVFLGSWRNTVIVSTSIPLSIFAGIIGLFLTGNTINLMTLGGLALAIGLLVDNATVTIENIHRNQSLGKPLTVAILDGAQRGDPAADRRHAGDLHRVLPGRAAVRRGALPVHSAGRHRRVLHAGVLCAVVQRGAVVRALPAGIARRSITARRAASSAMFDRGFNRFRDGYGRLLEGALHRRVFVLVCAGALLVVSRRAGHA